MGRLAKIVVAVLLVLVTVGCEKDPVKKKVSLDWDTTQFFFQLALVAAEQQAAPLGVPLTLGDTTRAEVETYLAVVQPPPEEVEKQEDYLEADFGSYRWVFWTHPEGKLRALGAIVRLAQDSKAPELVAKILSDRFGVAETSLYSFELDGEMVETDLDVSAWTTPHGRLSLRVPYDAERSFSYLVLELTP